MTTTGMIQDVTSRALGSELIEDAEAGALVLVVDSAGEFDEAGGLLRIGGDDENAEVLRYTTIREPDDDDDLADADYLDETSVGVGAGFGGAEVWDSYTVGGHDWPTTREDDEEIDEENIDVGPSTIHMVGGATLTRFWPAGTRVDVWDEARGGPSIEWRALVRTAGEADNNDAIDAVVSFAVVPLLPEGVRTTDTGEMVTLDDSTGEWVVVNVAGAAPQIEGRMLSPGSVLPPSLGFTVGTTDVTISATPPPNPTEGDIWFDGTRGYLMVEWDGTAWVERQYGNSALASGAASRVFLQSAAPPDPRDGDLWIYVDTNGGMQPFRWDPDIVVPPGEGVGGPVTPTVGDWVPVVFNTEAIAAGQIAAGWIDVGVLQAVSIIAGSFTAGVIGGTDVVTTIVNSHIEQGSSLHLNGTGGNVLAYSAPTGTTNQTFTTTGTWVVPAGVTAVRVECFGAGGGGGYGSPNNRNGGGGGGGGEYARNESVPVTPGSTCTITIGGGGGGGTSAQGPGDGAFTRFTTAEGRTVTAHGGQGGRWDNPGRRGVGGSGSGAPVHYNGGNGIASTQLGYQTRGGGGGSSAGTGRPGNHATSYLGANPPPGGGPGGNGGAPGAPGGTNNGLIGQIPGGGGGGRSTAGTVGGAGARGEIRIRYSTAANGPQLIASLAGVAGTDDHTGVPIAYPRGLRVHRPDLVGLIGGYYQRVDLALSQEIPPNATTSNALTGLRNAQLISDFGNAWNYAEGIWTCPAVGLYDFTAGVVFATWINQNPLAIFITAGGGRLTAFASNQSGNVADGQTTTRGTRWCVPGEQIRVFVRQSTGNPQTIDGNAPGSYIAIHRVG